MVLKYCECDFMQVKTLVNGHTRILGLSVADGEGEGYNERWG